MTNGPEKMLKQECLHQDQEERPKVQHQPGGEVPQQAVVGQEDEHY